MISTYQQLLEEATLSFKQLSQKSHAIGTLRLVVALAILVSIYFAFREKSWLVAAIILLLLILFFYLVVIHKKINLFRKIAQQKITINENEIAFLEKNQFFSANGEEFQDDTHPYSYDLDIFGAHSLYQYINRTHTFLGRKSLATHFLSPKAEEIAHLQAVTQELSKEEHLRWRQEFIATTALIGDTQEFYEQMEQWAAREEKAFPRLLKFFLWGASLLVIFSLIAGYGLGYEGFKVLGNTLITINLLVFLTFIGKIQKSKLGFENTYHLLYTFKKSIALIEKANQFKSTRFQLLQEKLHAGEQSASSSISQLSRLLDDLDNVGNILVSIPLNIFTFYHLHTYRKLQRWKQAHAKHIASWLSVIAEVEVLHSFANFSYNNPSFAYPSLNDQQLISFESLGHPLIPAKGRVCNTISFASHRFVILTGSNMSGKSTFLRALGVNMLLATMGLPVCAQNATIHPMKLLVSMRLSDSLSDGKSYFYAEINRLRTIMDQLEKAPCFVLLDELLRGTNSEDKQSGTFRIIEKMVALNAIGVIATHDLEVCTLSEKYPDTLQNKCFESQIIAGELYFDYTLKEGICQNKNATFLMEKMGVI